MNLPVKSIPDTFTVLLLLHVRNVRAVVCFLQKGVQVQSVDLI